MKKFTDLYLALDQTTSTNAKVELLREYFVSTPAEDAVWALFFLMGRKRKKVITSTVMRRSFFEASTLPKWLLEDSFSHVGDTAESVSLLLQQPQYYKAPDQETEQDGDKIRNQWEQVLNNQDSPDPSWEEPHPEQGLNHWIQTEVRPLERAKEREKRKKLWQWWTSFTPEMVLVANKILGGSFRIGVSKALVVRALSRAIDVDEAKLTYRLSGAWDPSSEFFKSLGAEEDRLDISRPYPFYLAYPLEDPKVLGEDPSCWWAEWKWDGIRSQGIHRQGQSFLWSRGEDLINESFPEIAEALKLLPDGTVIDAELLAWRDGQPLNFQELQMRLGRLSPSRKVMDEAPVILMAYDLLELEGKDLRSLAFIDRRNKLEVLLKNHPNTLIQLSPSVAYSELSELEDLRAQSREHRTEGLMIKAKDSPYREGRKRGDWWKYKVDPYTIDAVLLYAQAGTGRRSNLFTDYTFALWGDQDELLPITKAYSGLTDEEISELDSWIRKNTNTKFGPVRSVTPEQVFELGFENISYSKRHKSGIAVRFPRILRWRKDKPANEADHIESLRALINQPVSKKKDKQLGLSVPNE